MKLKGISLVATLAVALALAAPTAALAQTAPSAAPVSALPVVAAADQMELLKSKDPRLAKNKKLVFDFWREVLEAGHMDLAEKYMAEDYRQHNPTANTGRAAFIKIFGSRPPREISPTIKAPVVSIVAEGDLVVLSFVRTLPDPQDATKTYTTTWFDMLRVKDGKVVEHWDTATKR